MASNITEIFGTSDALSEEVKTSLQEAWMFIPINLEII